MYRNRPAAANIMRLAGLCMLASLTLRGATLNVDSPREYEVFQRSSFHQGLIEVRGNADAACDAAEVRIGKDVRQRIAASAPCRFDTQITVPAGGWYPIEIRALRAGAPVASATVKHAGIGEVFVISGQSNSTNYGEEPQQTRTGMVATFDGKDWRPANDPQPGVQDASKQGSFIPAFGDAMYEHYKVPIGVASVGSGSTSVRQWLPKGDRFSSPPTNAKFVVEAGAGVWESTGKLFDGMLERIRELKSFRAVLWHQGESDANQPRGHEIDPAEYQRMMERLIREMRARAGWDFPWFVAQASYHNPSDTGTPGIRAAQAALWKEGLALEGPDTDALTGDDRQNHGQGVHMSAKGLKIHGRLWAEKVEAWLDSKR